MVKPHKFRAVRISDDLVKAIENWMTTKEAKNLGIHTISGAVDYACKRLIDR